MFEQQAPTYKATLLEMNHDRDHVHILFKASPNTELSKFINVYKASTSRIIKKEFPDVANHFGIISFGRLVILFNLLVERR